MTTMARSVRLATATVLLGALLGCVHPLRSDREEWPRIGDEFARALRWGDFKAAATFVTDEARSDFVAAYPADGALRVTDARHEPDGPVVDKLAKGKLMLEYYRLSSMTVKRATLPVEWSCIGGNSIKPCDWRLALPPARLP